MFVKADYMVCYWILIKRWLNTYFHIVKISCHKRASMVPYRFSQTCAFPTEGTKMGGRSSGSATRIETETVTESGRRSVGRKRGNASSDRMRSVGEEGNNRMETTPSRSGRRRLKKIKPWRRRRVKTCQTPHTLRSQRSLLKTTRRRRVGKESGYEIR